MPCRNDYDPPSQAQQANRVAARLLIVLNNKQNHLSSTQLLVDSTNTYLETDYVKVLCERLTEMNAFDRDALLYGDARDASARELATWWEEHLERDRKRKAEEAVESPAWPAEPNPHAPFVNLQWAWDLADQSTQAGSIIGTLVNESRLLRKRIEFLRKPGPDTARAREERDHFKKALHGISLASQSSIGSKEECGRIASKALEEARQWRIKATDEQQAQGADRPVPSAVLKDSLNKILDASVAQQITDAAYTERNHLVALLSKIYPAGKARTAIEGWSPEWHGCVYIDFPWGQASWHYHDRDAGLFNHLEPYRGSWDGHTTEAKYELIRQAVAAPQEQANMGPGRHWWPVSKGHADNVCAAAPQQAEPVAWMAFGGALVHAVTRNAMDPIEAERFDVPLYLHPPAAPQQAEPVAQIGWADEFGNLFPMAAWKPAQRTHHDSHKTAWRPVFLHPPAAEVQRLREALEYLIEKCGDSDDAQYSTLGTKFVRDIARRALEGGE